MCLHVSPDALIGKDVNVNGGGKLPPMSRRRRGPEKPERGPVFIQRGFGIGLHDLVLQGISFTSIPAARAYLEEKAVPHLVQICGWGDPEECRNAKHFDWLCIERKLALRDRGHRIVIAPAYVQV